MHELLAIRLTRPPPQADNSPAMAIGPRLDLRQTQTLVMTPQLRQAIKLLQYSNLEVASFVEEELERNPLLERDESADAPVGRARRAGPGAWWRPSATRTRCRPPRPATLPSEAAAPLDADHADTYDAGGVADGGPSLRPHRRPRRRPATSTATTAASTTWRTTAARCASIWASSSA